MSLLPKLAPMTMGLAVSAASSGCLVIGVGNSSEPSRSKWGEPSSTYQPAAPLPEWTKGPNVGKHCAPWPDMAKNFAELNASSAILREHCGIASGGSVSAEGSVNGRVVEEITVPENGEYCSYARYEWTSVTCTNQEKRVVNPKKK